MTFDGRLLAGVGVLDAVITGGNFVRAGEALGISASGVSRAISRLETRIGVRLLDRTTRSVTLTDEGRRFYEEVGPLLTGIEEAATSASAAAGTVRGRLRVDIDPFFSRLVLARSLGGFLEHHPALSLELITREHVGDLVIDGIDVAMRFGEPPASSVIARKLIQTRILTVAAPAYLAQHGRPKHPSELVDHACILFRNPVTGQPFAWEFHQGRKVVAVKASGRLCVSDVGTMLEGCMAGAGIGQVMALGIQDDLDQGRLVELFPDWPGEMFPLYALYPSRHHPPAKVRAFIDFVLQTTQ
jgi:DNA-binding transcriptional LysR family regulator